jgi:predicted DNA-binding transcriptional regulator
MRIPPAKMYLREAALYAYLCSFAQGQRHSAKSISKDFFDSPRSIQHSLNYLIDQKLIKRRRVKGGYVAYWHH